MKHRLNLCDIVKLALISDIHSNLEALVTVLEDIDSHHPDDIVCLGDVVGYGADPSPCLKIIRERCSEVLLGNHDEASVDPFKAFTFNPIAFAAIEWTNQKLSDEEKEYLQKRPLTVTRGPVLCVHASPVRPEEWEYIIDDYDAEQAFGTFKEKICCVGHSHSAGIYVNDASLKPADPDFQCVVNVGSVGQPRDRDPRSSWCLIDTESLDIKIHRVEYDIDEAARKIRAAGLPIQLAERLYRGV